MDTPIWSYALRSDQQSHHAEVAALTFLIRDQRALIIGPIRQELLSGYSDIRAYQRLRKKLAAFGNTPILDADYEAAAQLCNACRRQGVQGSHTDFLICAVAKRIEAAIFTTDRDFDHYDRIVTLKLFKPC